MTPDQIIDQEQVRQRSRAPAMALTPNDIIASEKTRLANSASGSFYTMRETQPDRATKVISLSGRMGADRGFVDRNLETMEETAADQEREGLLAQFPKVSQFLSDPYRAAEARDSVPNFADIERIYAERRKKKRGWLEAPFSQTGDLGRSAAGDLVGMFGQGVRGAGDVVGAYVDTMRSAADMVPGLREGLAELDRVEAELVPGAVDFAPQNYLRTAGGGVAELGEIIRPVDMGFEDKVAGAVGQIVGAVLTTMAGGPAASTSLFMGMGADQQGQAMRNAGHNPDQMLPELIGGAGVTGLSEQLRLGSIMRVMPREARERVASKVISRILGQASEEVVQEGTEGVLQNLITTTYDAEASLFEGVAEQMTTAGTAAAVFQAFVEAALPGRSRGIRAESNAQELADIREIIEQTPVFQRSRESIEAFLQQAGEGETVLLHGEDLIELYQSDPEVFAQRMDEVGLTEEGISRAMDGHDIEVEAAKVLSVSEGFEDWVKIVKSDEDAPSLREMEREIEESDAMGAVDFTEAFERIAEQDEALEGFERVQSAVTQQLLGAGRGQAEAEAAGAVWGAMFRQLAEAGIDEGAVFDRLGLRINEPVQIDGDLLNQAFEAGYKGSDQSEALEWLGATEAGLGMSQEARMSRAESMGFDTGTVWYHGTNADIEQFSRFKARGNDREIGIHVGTVDQANFMAKAKSGGMRRNTYVGAPNVIPLHVRAQKSLRLPDLGNWSPENMAAVLRQDHGFEITPTGASGEVIGVDIRQALKDAGYDSIVYKNAYEGNRDADSLILFDTEQLRSVNAAFDPDHAGSANLLHQRAIPIPSSEGLVAIRADELGFTTSAEKALFDPPPRFRDARNLTAVQWRKYFTEAGATKEAFEFMIDPALATLPKTGDIRKADVIKAVRAQRPKVRSSGNFLRAEYGDLKRWQQAALNKADSPDLYKLSNRERKFVLDYEARQAHGETDYSAYVSPGQHTNYRQELIVMPEAAEGYRSHNWNTEGVVGHIRTTDRQTVKGEAVRFVDELQSDLHQEAVQSGYKGDPSGSKARLDAYDNAAEKYRRARDRLSAYMNELSEKAGKPPTKKDVPDDAKAMELYREEAAAGDALDEAGEAARSGARLESKRPPRAPVKDWEKPFIRRVIQQAIADDKDVVAFTNYRTLHEALQNEGTRKFYDERLPAHIRKVAKDIGATLEKLEIKQDGGFFERSARIEKLKSELRTVKNEISKLDRTDKRLRKKGRELSLGEDNRLDRLFNRLDRLHSRQFDIEEELTEIEAAKRPHRVSAIRITPEAKEKLAKGNVLFQGGQSPRASVLIPGEGALSEQDVFVRLTKAVDRTSFLHESAHIFLELYSALEGENEVIAERMGSIRKWLRIKPGEEITRDQHEKFAESFEAYLMEGVAPSAELRSVFHSFRQWFVDVYRRLRGQLRQLEPEARAIFDRMLASDVEIEMAQGQYVGTLSKAMEGLMSPEQVEKYQKHALKAGNVARDRLFKKHMDEVKRRERKAYKEERDRVEDVARQQLMTWPEYKALAAFGEGGRSLDAVESPENTKLNVSEKGEHPEIVASEMGFLSADEMFKKVEKAAPFDRVLKGAVDKIMGDRFGDMMRDGTIESEAMEAVFNEPTIRMMEAERNALAEKASAQPIPLIAIRKEADRLINTMPIDQVIKPGRYAIKARDLHKRALRSAAKDKWDDALRYTHQAMLQHELARRAFKARDEIEKANRYLAKFAAHRKLDPKKIAPNYIEKIREFVGLPGAQDQAAIRDGLTNFVDVEANEGRSVVLPSELLAGRDLPIRRRMTMEQFREFRDTVKNLNKLGRQLSAEAQEAFNADAQALADEIDANFKGNRIRETRNPTRVERANRIGRQIDATIIRWPFLVEALQGGKIGKVIEAFDTRIRQALTNRNARRQEMADKLAEIFRKHGITQSELNKRVSASVIESGNVKFEQIMAVALNMGTEQNRERLISDPSLRGDAAAIEAMLAEHLEKRHWDAAQEIWDLINTLWPEASAVERNATGVTPKKVNASSVDTKFGAYRGGYYPLKYDRAFLTNNDLQKQDEIEEWKNGVNGMATRASTRQGFLKERQQNVERPLDLSLGVILNHIDDVTNDIYMRDPASYVSRLLNKNRIRKAIRETQGDEYLRTMETILKRTVTGTERPDTAFERFLQTMRINASVAILGANVVTAGLAPISYVQTVIPQYGFKTVFSGIAEYYSDPIKHAKLIAEKSAFMRERQDTLTREAHELIRKSAGQSRFAKVRGAGYWMMAIFEKHSVSGPLWVGVYNQAKAEGASEADAVTVADRAVSTTQGSGLEIDQSVMQGGNEGLRLLSFMWGYASGYYGTVRNDVVSEKGLKKLMPLVKHMVILNIVASMLEALIRGGFGDDEDPYVIAVWQMMLRNTFGLIPGVSSALSKYDSGPAAMQVGTSMTRATENWIKAGGQVYEDGEAEGETVRRAMLDTLKAGGFLLGVPGTVQAMKIEKTYAEDDDPTLYEAIVSGPDDDN